MYVWVLLTTFLAVLASYTLSVRTDMRELEVEPLAHVSLGKMLVQHKAATDYMKYNKNIDFSVVYYSPGIISNGDLENELPMGYNLSVDSSGNNEYTSQIFCMNDDMTGVQSGADPCNAEKVKRYVVTYGQIPQRWLDLSDPTKPNVDYLNIMKKSVSYGDRLGYMVASTGIADPVKNPSNSNVQLESNLGEDKVFVPLAVVNDVHFKSKCDLANDKICIVYMSNL